MVSLACKVMYLKRLLKKKIHIWNPNGIDFMIIRG